MPSTAKFEVRVTPDFKEDLQLAADAVGMSITEFAIRHLRPCIDDVLRREREWQMDEAQSRKFVDALLSDAEPVEALKAAARRHEVAGLDA